MTKILSSKSLVDERIPALTEKCRELKAKGLTPFMKVILVGNSPASLLYIKNKKRLCEKIEANFELIHLEESISEKDFLKTVDQHNKDTETTGLFIQFPLPDHLKKLPVASLISPEKDVDGFHPQNIYGLYSGDSDHGLYPCTPKGVLKLLKYNDIEINGKNAVVIGRSLIVGKPMAILLGNENATVTLCHSKTQNIKDHTKRADIIISAVGKARYLTKDYLRDTADQTLVDIGINQDEDNKLCGDLDFENIKDHCHAITPVPGGIGPLTVLSLIENLILATQNQIENK